ncbi:MAG: HAD-IC family P-type ATPase [Acidimicrobiales bacterium]|nr:HAD-IC family P-type ATPase [Acidimicrobiales bacterium]
MALLDRLRPVYDLPHRHRRVWATPEGGRVHVELRELDGEATASFAEHLVGALDGRPGIRWVEVLSAPGRAVVAFDPDVVGPAWCVAVVDDVERRLGVEHTPFANGRPDHPGDHEPIVRDLVALGADATGLALALVGRALRVPTLPIEVDTAALLSLLANVPRARDPIDRRLTTPVAELALAVGNGIAAGLAQGPLGPLLDIVHRGSLLGEAEGRRRAWVAREPELCATPSAHPIGPLYPPTRPAPLRPGPIERYDERVLLASLGGFAVAVPLLRSLDRAAAALLAGVPKAARLGREAFAAQVGRLLAQRGVVILDPDALRTLDRLDVAVLDGRLLVADQLEPATIEVLDDTELAVARRRVTELFRPDAPTVRHEVEGWALGPLTGADEHVARRARLLAAGRPVLLLEHHDRPRALVQLRTALAPQAADLVAAVRSAGLEVIVTADDERTVLALQPDRVVPPVAAARVVEGRQAEGHGVLMVAMGTHAGLREADCGVGVPRPGEPVPWDADLVGGPDLADACLVAVAGQAAREVSRQSAALAFGGATASTFIAFGGLVPGTTQRVMTTINVATALALVNGTRAGLALRGAALPPPADDVVPWHALDADAVLARLRTTPAGLAPDEAARRRPPAPPTSPPGLALARAVADEVINPLTPVLAVGAGLSLAVGSVGDAAMVASVVALNAVIGGVQRHRTERAIARLGRRERQHVTVRRHGRLVTVPADSLVPGDVVRLAAGDAVPADCRILTAEAVEADESSLTGESLPVAKHAEASHAASVADRTSMLYDGTSLAAGTATGVVVAVGAATEAERGATAGAGRAPASGVEARLESITTLVTPVSVLAGLGVVGSGLLRARPLADLVGAGVSLAVAAVPEGLPLLATVAQHSSARRLSGRGALVRNVRAVEALGRVDVLCADKTGTLTEGHIRLRVVSDGDSEWRDGGTPLTGQHRQVLAAALRATPDVASAPRLPHPTDRAVVRGAEVAGLAAADAVGAWVRVDELPFEPGRAFHATLADTPAGRLLSVKGAPEVLLPRCTHRRTAEGARPLDEGERARLAAGVDPLARRGFRVLAVAERQVDDAFTVDDPDAVDGLVFAGLLGLSDPVRPTAASAVCTLRRAGVSVIMITGDHPSTAEGIAAELDLLDEAAVLTGPDIDELDDDELAVALLHTSVCARVTPLHKVRIVRSLQHAGRVVAMTGDGANDAPAIRLADVGVALGTRATTAARDAADLVVTDDRIETIVDAVVEGRAMWASVRDAVAILVGGNLGEITFTLAGSVLSGTSPLNARQLLLVNLLTDVAPAMAIAVRPPTRTTPEQLLLEGPDRSLGTALNRAIAVRAVATAGGAGTAWAVGRLTGTAERASTVSLVALVGSQLGQTLVSGGASLPVLAAGLGSFAVMAGIVQTPGVSHLFGCRPLGPAGWATALGASAAATAASLALPSLLDRLGAVGPLPTPALPAGPSA